jgi:hypothetical protein
MSERARKIAHFLGLGLTPGQAAYRYRKERLLSEGFTLAEVRGKGLPLKAVREYRKDPASFPLIAKLLKLDDKDKAKAIALYRKAKRGDEYASLKLRTLLFPPGGDSNRTAEFGPVGRYADDYNDTSMSELETKRL